MPSDFSYAVMLVIFVFLSHFWSLQQIPNSLHVKTVWTFPQWHRNQWNWQRLTIHTKKNKHTRCTRLFQHKMAKLLNWTSFCNSYVIACSLLMLTTTTLNLNVILNLCYILNPIWTKKRNWQHTHMYISGLSTWCQTQKNKLSLSILIEFQRSKFNIFNMFCFEIQMQQTFSFHSVNKLMI